MSDTYTAPILCSELIQNALQKFSTENNCEPPILWYHDGADCFISRHEKPFIRSMQISIMQNTDAIFIEITPELYRDDEEKRKRYVCKSIPDSYIRRVFLPVIPFMPENVEHFFSELAKNLSAAWENTYFITPDMLITEIPLSPFTNK